MNESVSNAKLSNLGLDAISGVQYQSEWTLVDNRFRMLPTRLLYGIVVFVEEATRRSTDDVSVGYEKVYIELR